MATRHSRSMTESSIAASVHSLQNVEDTPGAWIPSRRDTASPVDEISSPVSSQQTLSRAVWERRGEYTRPDTVRIKVGTWNVASKSGTEKDLAGWFFGGKGIAERLVGIELRDNESDVRETAGDQERNLPSRDSTLPSGDHGSVPGGADVGIYALGLQEIVDISSVWEHSKPWADPTVANKFKSEAERSLPPGYQLVAEKQLIGLLLLVWASPSVAPHLHSVSEKSLGTGGLMKNLGNKGAVAARLVLGESTRLVFVNCHMAAGADKSDVDRRNTDAELISTRIHFDPVVDSLGVPAPNVEKIGEEDFAFWFGDLNYRLDGIPGDDVRRLLMLHTRNEYDIGQREELAIEQEIADLTQEAIQQRRKEGRGASESASESSSPPTSSFDGTRSSLSAETATSLDEAIAEDPSQDPTSLQTTLNSLLPHDELQQQMKKRKMFHDGWQEGPINFLPTYKYDVGSVGRFDSSDKRRGPSWCDRIIFRTRKDLEAYHTRLRDEAESRKRDEDLKAKGIDKAAEDESTLFEYDPDADGDVYDEDETPDPANAPPEKLMTKEGYDDILALEYYLSHQRVLSSDHKPLEAIFTLKYDAVMPELKAKVHQEVARDLDRAENEGRPVLTLVVDGEPGFDDPKFDGVNFKEIRFRDPKVRSVTIANNGGVTAYFGFVNRPVGKDGSAQPLPQWLTVQVDVEVYGGSSTLSKKKHRSTDDWDFDIQQTYKIDPGETCTVNLIANVEEYSLARELNEGEQMEDVLVLRVKDGRDHFLPVHGSWQQSVHGRTIEMLSKIPEGGIRLLQSQSPKAKGGRSRGSSTTSETYRATKTGSNGKAEPPDNNVGNANATQIWSAPREIYRLTAAVESLAERLLAEWSMLAATAIPGSPEPDESSTTSHQAPWTKTAGWPFTPESWTLKPSRRQTLATDAREALDTDREFDKSWSTEDIINAEKVQILSGTLIELLESLEDGVITSSMWETIETEFFARRLKEKAAWSIDDQRAAILEILSVGRAHSVSFVLLTSMLAHLSLEVSSALQEVPDLFTHERGKTDALGLGLDSPRVHVKRKALDADPAVARRQLVKKNYAAMFADVMVRVEGDEKKFRDSEDRRREVIEVFLGE